jgi:phosphatidylglycerophosphate synthase
MKFARRIPWLLIVLRALLGPLILVGTSFGVSGKWIAGAIVAGFLSDIFDGIIARRIGSATERLRVADSWTDAAFYGCIAGSIWLTRREAVQALAVPLIVSLVIKGLSALVDLARYRRITSYHTYGAKLWGITLFVAALGLLAFNNGRLLWPAIVVSVVCSLEGIAITLLLPCWTHDVPTLWHAWRLRREIEQKR